MKKLLALALVFASVLDCAADLKKIESDLPYQSENSDEYISERCKLDIFAPENKADKKLPVIVWFHGGGITSGNKSGFPKLIRELNIIFVTANYRLSPKIKAATAIEDAAAAVAWTFENIEKFGGDKSKIYVGGHSAGAYLSGMVGFNPGFLKKHNLSNTDIAGLLLVSGQATSHFQVRKDLGDKRAQYAHHVAHHRRPFFLPAHHAKLLYCVHAPPIPPQHLMPEKHDRPFHQLQSIFSFIPPRYLFPLVFAYNCQYHSKQTTK